MPGFCPGVAGLCPGVRGRDPDIIFRPSSATMPGIASTSLRVVRKLTMHARSANFRDDGIGHVAAPVFLDDREELRVQGVQGFGSRISEGAKRNVTIEPDRRELEPGGSLDGAGEIPGGACRLPSCGPRLPARPEQPEPDLEGAEAARILQTQLVEIDRVVVTVEMVIGRAVAERVA